MLNNARDTYFASTFEAATNFRPFRGVRVLPRYLRNVTQLGVDFAQCERRGREHCLLLCACTSTTPATTPSNLPCIASTIMLPSFALLHEKVDRLRTDNVSLTLGHQYFPQLQPLSPDKHIRSFNILCHPFDRKLSLLFHFIVCVRRRSEDDVSMPYMHAFLLK